MSKKLKILSLFALIHCCIVILGAGGIRLHSKGPLGELVTYYGALTGAERGFGFFAPQVSTQARATFDIVDKNGKTLSRAIEEGASEEAVLRINNMGSKFWQILDGGNLELRHSMAASWAGKMFGRYPTANEVTVYFEVFQMQSMEEYRQGKRPYWKRIYQSKFLQAKFSQAKLFHEG